MERGLLILTPAQCQEMFAFPCSSSVTSSLKGILPEGLVANFLPQLESGGDCQSLRESKNTSLFRLLEGGGSITDKDCTV